MRIRTANEIMLRRMESMQAAECDGSPHTFVWKGTEYPCSETGEQTGLEGHFAGYDQKIVRSLIVRIELFKGGNMPVEGHTLTCPDLDDQAFRVVTAEVSADRSHLILTLGEPLNQ